jgi:hypothetical protein
MASKELFDDGDVFNTKPCAVCGYSGWIEYTRGFREKK